MTPLTDDEKRSIVRTYYDLCTAVHADTENTGEKYQALLRVYRGDLLGYLQAFATANDKKHWIGQLGVYLRDEIESSFW